MKQYPFFGFLIILVLFSRDLTGHIQKNTHSQNNAQYGLKITQPDTTLANEYFANAEQFLKKAEYDSAIVYFDKTSEIYKKIPLWAKYLHCVNQIGLCFWRKGDYDKAMDYGNQVLEIGSQQLGENHPEIAIAYVNIGDIYWKKANFDQALDYYNKALAIQLPALGERHSDVARTYNTMAIMYRKKRNLEKSLDLYDKALSIRLATLDAQHPDIAQTYSNIGIVYSDKGDYNEALVYLNKALSIFITALGEKHPQVSRIYNNIGVMYNYKGDLDRSLEFYKKSLTIDLERLGPQHPTLTLTYNNIGIIYFKKGDYDQALVYHNKALSGKIAKFGELHPSVGMSYNNLGVVYGDKEDYGQALVFFKKALSIWKSTLGEQHPAVTMSYANIGLIYYNKNDYDQALFYQNKAHSITLNAYGEQHPELAPSYSNIGGIYAKKGKYNQALNHYEKALSIRLSTLGDKHPEIATDYNNMGEIYFEQDENQSALDFYQKSICANIPGFSNTDLYVNPSLDNILSESELLRSLKYKARSLSKRYENQTRDLRDMETALLSYQSAIELIDKMRSSYKTESSKLFLGEKIHQIYDQAIQTAHSLYEITRKDQYKEEAFFFAEKSKSAVLQESLLETKAKQFADIPDSLLEKEKALKIDLAYYDTQIQKEYLKKEDQDSVRIKDFENRFFALNTQYQNLIASFEKKYPDYYNLKYQLETVSIEDIQDEILDQHNVLVEYFIGDSSIYIFTITEQDFDLIQIAKAPSFEQAVDSMRTGLIEKDYFHYTKFSYQLYQTLIEPIESKVRNRQLIIIPDAVLCYVPFEAIIKKPANEKLMDYSSLSYLVKDHFISYSYSATLLLENMLTKSSRYQQDFAGFAPIFMASEFDSTRNSLGELRWTQEEVKYIGKLFDNSEIFLNQEATEQTFKEKAGLYGILHLATHTVIQDDKPINSELIFSRDTTSIEDGYLNVKEIYNLELSANLVVLSACNTGFGKLVRGEGIMSLARGFMYAGCPSIIMSLWSVDDKSTAEMMQYFYEELSQGKRKDEALQQAKLRYLQSRNSDSILSNPYYWAGFVSIGNIHPIEKTLNLNSLIVLSFIGIAILIIIIRKKILR